MASTRGPNEHITATRDGDNMPINIYGWHGGDVQQSLALATTASDTFNLEVGHFYELTADIGADKVFVFLPTGSTAIRISLDTATLQFKVLVGQFANNATTGTMTITNDSGQNQDFTLRELL